MMQHRPHLSFLFFSVLCDSALFDFAHCNTPPNTNNPIQNLNVSNTNSTLEFHEKFYEPQPESESELISNVSQKRLDKFFSLDSSIFEKYLRDVDLSIIPGMRDDDDFDNWVPPEEIQRDLPFYLAGFDFRNQPFWIIEYGKHNYSKYATGGRKLEELFQKYFRYFTYTAIKSRAIKSTAENRINHHGFLIDFEGLGAENVLNRRAFLLQLKLIKNYRHFAEQGVSKLVCINLNPISENLFRVGKMAVTSLLKVAEIYGTDKPKWVPALLKSYPKDQLPQWYGGDKGFKPLYVIG